MRQYLTNQTLQGLFYIGVLKFKTIAQQALGNDSLPFQDYSSKFTKDKSDHKSGDRKK